MLGCLLLRARKSLILFLIDFSWHRREITIIISSFYKWGNWGLAKLCICWRLQKMVNRSLHSCGRMQVCSIVKSQGTNPSASLLCPSFCIAFMFHIIFFPLWGSKTKTVLLLPPGYNWEYGHSCSKTTRRIFMGKLSLFNFNVIKLIKL